MATTITVPGSGMATGPSPGAAILHTLRVIVVAGIACGVIVAGLGSRLAMLLLRVTSGGRVNGVTSDDDFEIGRVTLGGTYNLLLIGAGFGIVGAGTYLLVRTWLIGPLWLRRATVGLASGAVAGSGLLHDDGIDFHLLTPTWLAMSLFVILPVLFGVSMAMTVERVDRASVASNTARFWVVPLVLVAMFPPVALLLVFVGSAVVVVTLASLSPVWRSLRSRPVVRLLFRTGWLAIAVLGAWALVVDIAAIS